MANVRRNLERLLSDRSSFIIHPSSLNSCRGYTLIEVLVVAVVIVLMLGMALPVFHAITGSRSEAGASNLIASMLGRTRTDAIGLQKPVGVAFLYNPSSQLSYMGEVTYPQCPAWTQGLVVPPLGYINCNFATTTTYYYVNPGPNSVTLIAPPPAPSEPAGMYLVGGPPLELQPDTELLPLPAGIGVQTVCNCYIDNTGKRVNDGYLSFGVVLFDGHGRIISQNYGISGYSKLMSTSGLNINLPSTIHSSNPPTPPIVYPYTGGPPYAFGVPSQFGVVVFQSEAFIAQNFPTQDPAYYYTNTSQSSQYTTGSPSQKTEEDWLDQNSTPLLLNRYTGTLVKGE